MPDRTKNVQFYFPQHRNRDLCSEISHQIETNEKHIIDTLASIVIFKTHTEQISS